VWQLQETRRRVRRVGSRERVRTASPRRVVVVVREDGPQLDDGSRGSPLKNESPRTFPEAPLLNQKLRTCRAQAIYYVSRSTVYRPHKKVFFVLCFLRAGRGVGRFKENCVGACFNVV